MTKDIKTLKSLAEKFTILYVEDESDIRQSMHRYFEKIFKNVDIAQNGKEGLDLYSKNKYDIVISDIKMPVMDGLEMIVKIKEINPEQETIIVSAYTEIHYFIDAIKLGVSGYIIKPTDNDQIIQVLYSAVDKLSRFKENEEYKSNLKEMVEARNRSLIELEEEKNENFEKTIISLVSLIDNRDTYTAGHSKRVAEYCKMIAKEMGKSDEVCDFIYKAGILHDIGKVATPDSVLLKPGTLSKLEYELIKEHVTTSYNVLDKIPMYKEMAEIIFCHHERYDGNGYPRGLTGDEIPPLAQIMIVADAFDAMTSSRVYKVRKNVTEAIKELEACSGTQFDPQVVKRAKNILSTVTIDHSAVQTPETEIEKKRFDYFYKDQISSLYNTNYLNVVLGKNAIKKKFICINILYLRNFSQYNAKYGWTCGDLLLKDMANYLLTEYPSATIFRIHGDDFVLISETHLEIDPDQFEALKTLKKNNMHLEHTHIDLHTQNVESMGDLERLVGRI